MGPEFQIRNRMDRCDSIVPEEETVSETHSIRDTHEVMLKKETKKTFSLDAFLEDGIEQMTKRPFKELLPTLKSGDQIWIYRDRKANCVSRIMPYAHVAVYVGDNKVVHVTKSAQCCVGVMMGTIEKVPIGNVIKDNDQGDFTHYIVTSQFPNHDLLIQFSWGTRSLR